MDDIIGQAAYNRLDAGTRQCTATSKTTGERCRRSPIVGGFVCDHHGGKIPAVRASARERLLAMVDPAMDALVRAMRTGPPCEACGRSDADRDPVVVRAAQIVLDRTGYGPSAKLTVTAAAPAARWGEWMTNAELQAVQEITARAKQRMLAGESKADPREPGLKQLVPATIDAQRTSYEVTEDDEDGRLSPHQDQTLRGVND